MKVRKFWITNGNNQTIQFTDGISKIFLNNPTGLGMSNSITTLNYNEKMNVISNVQEFGSIGGEMLFYDYANKDKYEAYNDFITFLSFKPLTFFYQIPSEPAKTYSIDVDIMSIDKTEVKKDDLLKCDFQLQTLSRWKGEKVTVSGSGSEFEITNDSHMPVGFEITMTFENSVVNPSFTLEQDDAVYGIAKFIDQYDTSIVRPGLVPIHFKSVYVNSNDGEQNVELKNSSSSVLPNPLSYQDLSVSNGQVYVTFMKLARGTSILKIYSDDTVQTANVLLEFIPLYRSV